MVRCAVIVSVGSFGCTGEPSADAGPEAESERQGPAVHGTAPAAVRGVPSFVTLEPRGRPSAVLLREPATIDQFGLAFSPTVVVVGVGERVSFTNSESALVHNVQVRSTVSDSLLFTGDAASGDVIEVVFPEEGAYDVLCEYHPGMTALVVATDAPHVAVAEPDGSFEVVLPRGEYTMRIWSADAALRSERSVLVGDTPVRIDARD